MSLQEVRIENLRCIQSAELELCPRLNLISGPNGSGKTSVLEAIHVLGRGRSFRTRMTERLIRRGTPRLRVFGRTDGALPHDLGVGCDRESGVEARVDRRPADGLAELSTLLPLQLIDPGIHRLVEEGPLQRRRWVDWGVFHVEPGFIRDWTDYTRALRQRNAALKQGVTTEPWDLELARFGEGLARSRQALLHSLEPLWHEICGRLLEGIHLEWAFHRGWSQDHSLAESLQLHLPRDRERGSTGIGAHRFDVTLKSDGRLAREVLSGGQQKLLGASMTLAMARLAANAGPQRHPMLLLDDPAAELDRDKTRLLKAEIAALDCQLVVTALDPDRPEFGPPDRAFHVEQGRVKQL
jgi:DNA replication and repair protein RecF